MPITIKRTGNNRKKSVIIYIITILIMALLLFAAFNRGNGSSFEKTADGSYHYYLPSTLEGGGTVQFSNIRKTDKNGHELIWQHSLLYSAKYGYGDSTPKAAANTVRDIGQNLYGCYYEDGRFAYALFNCSVMGRDGRHNVTRCLEIALYDEEGKNAEYYARDCGDVYAADIAGSIQSCFPSTALSRLFIVCNGTLEAYISEEEREFNKESCEKVPLINAKGVDSESYLNAVLLSSGDSGCTDLAAERAAELLRGGFLDEIIKKDGFEVIVIKEQQT